MKHACTVVSATDCQHVCTCCTRVVCASVQGGGGIQEQEDGQRSMWKGNNRKYKKNQKITKQEQTQTKATISAQGNQKEYFGLTKGPFKQRFNGHLTTFRHEEKVNATELSKHVWHLKRANVAFTIKWSICQRAPAYTSALKSCTLCLAEKLSIVNACKSSQLNCRSELMSTCRLRRKHLLVMHKGASK